MKRTRNIVDSNIDNNRAGLNPRSFDEFGLSNSTDNDISISDLDIRK